MSELRDLTSALRSMASRMTSIEDCLLIVVRNSEQEADWRHDQRGIEQRRELEASERGRALAQIQEFQGALWKYLAALDERLEALSVARHDDVKALNERVRKLEPADEVTQT
jgi:hypothetical protein